MQQHFVKGNVKKRLCVFGSRSPLLIRHRRRHDNCQQKNIGIQRKDLMAVPAAMPASSPKAMFSIKPSKGSLWTITWCEPWRQAQTGNACFFIGVFNRPNYNSPCSLWVNVATQRWDPRLEAVLDQNILPFHSNKEMKCSQWMLVSLW